MKHTTWICIAWKKGSHESVSKALVTRLPVTEKTAMREFKKAHPELRNHTVQPRL